MLFSSAPGFQLYITNSQTVGQEVHFELKQLHMKSRTLLSILLSYLFQSHLNRSFSTNFLQVFQLA